MVWVLVLVYVELFGDWLELYVVEEFICYCYLYYGLVVVVCVVIVKFVIYV